MAQKQGTKGKRSKDRRGLSKDAKAAITSRHKARRAETEQRRRARAGLEGNDHVQGVQQRYYRNGGTGLAPAVARYVRKRFNPTPILDRKDKLLGYMLVDAYIDEFGDKYVRTYTKQGGQAA